MTKKKTLKLCNKFKNQNGKISHIYDSSSFCEQGDEKVAKGKEKS